MGPRNVAFVGAICVIVGWLLASTLTPPVARVQTLPAPHSSARERAQEPAFTEQLQLRLSEVRPTPENRRNPFAFAAKPRTAAIEPEAPAPAAITQDAAPPVAAPAYVLSGIGINGQVRTAVLTTGADAHIVKVDDVIGAYTVAEISESTVTLVRGDERHVLRFVQ